MKLKNIFKFLKLYFEYIIYVLAQNFFKIFSFNFTSSIGGFLLKNFGQFSKYKKIISVNISLIETKTDKITNENLEHTGRVFFEFFNLNKFNWKNITIKNSEYLDLIHSHNGSKIFISEYFLKFSLTLSKITTVSFIE